MQYYLIRVKVGEETIVDGHICTGLKETKDTMEIRNLLNPEKTELVDCMIVSKNNNWNISTFEIPDKYCNRIDKVYLNYRNKINDQLEKQFTT